MVPLLKVECLACGMKYYVIVNDINSTVPKDVQPGEAFPSACPACESGNYAALADK
jgi:hypothetical protein